MKLLCFRSGRFIRTLIFLGALLTALFLIVVSLGLVFTYLSWLDCSSWLGSLLAAGIIGGVAFLIGRWIERRRERPLKVDSRPAQMTPPGRAKRRIPLSIKCAFFAVTMGYLGQLFDPLTGLAVEALELGGRRATPLLLHLAKTSADSTTRRFAKSSLYILGPDAAEAIPWFVSRVDKNDYHSGDKHVFEAIGPAAMPALVEAAMVESNDLRFYNLIKCIEIIPGKHVPGTVVVHFLRVFLVNWRS